MVYLSNGFFLFIEKIEVMWVVDVNLGKFKGIIVKEKIVELVNFKVVFEIFW